MIKIQSLQVGLGLVLVACGAEAPPPPATITVSPELPAAVREAAARARDGWCAAPVGWCPELVASGGEVEVRVEAFGRACTEDTPVGVACWGALHVASGDILVAPVSWLDLDGPLLHEFGHAGIRGHIDESALMRAEFMSDGVPTVVDAEAAAGWCAQQGC